MLDLNVDVVVSVLDAIKNGDRSDFQANCDIAVERNVQESDFHSGTSVSSVVLNADEDNPIVADDVEVDDHGSVTYSATDKQSFLVDSVSQTGELMEDSKITSVRLITRQFFPVTLEEEEVGSRLISSSPSAMSLLGADWLNLKVPESAQTMKPLQPQKARKSRRGPPSRSSQYRGVTFYRRTGRWESHIWDCGKQLYLGGFDTAHAAARAYDRAAIKFRGNDADINFNLSDYEEDMIQMKSLSKEEFIQILRRQRNEFSRESSRYRGVTLHKKAYDKAAIKCNGWEAITNFEPSTYGADINLKESDEERGHNLDLNLWISPTIYGPKRHHNVQNVDMGFTAPELPSGKRSEEMTGGMGYGASTWGMQMGSSRVAPVCIASAAASSGFSFAVTNLSESDPHPSMQNKTCSHITFNLMPSFK